MKSELPSPPGFWPSVRLLLAATRRRARGRRTRQQQLLSQRSSGQSTDWSGFGYAVAVLFMAFLNGGAAFVVRAAVDAGERIQVERQGKIIVSRNFLKGLLSAERVAQATSGNPDDSMPEAFYSTEAREIADETGGSRAEVERRLRDAVRNNRTEEFVTRDQSSPGLSFFLKADPLPALLGSVVLMWWAVMLVFQGEGLELDLQRRRHPMWEWLFSHPVPPGAIFLAEMISPMAANPIYWSGPLFAGFLYGMAYDPGVGLLATVLIGVPITIAAACLGKALEIGVILRFPPRSRGAMIGLMGWMGYASMMLFFVGAFFIPKAIHAAARFLDFFTIVPWPWLRWFLGGQADGSFSFLLGMLTCWFVAGITVAGAVWFSVWGTEQGLSGNFVAFDAGPSPSRRGGTHFGKDPFIAKSFCGSRGTAAQLCR
jgi:hypothetical protein